MNSALYQRILQENVRPSVCELKLKRSDYNFDKGAIGPIGDEAIVIIDCEGMSK